MKLRSYLLSRLLIIPTVLLVLLLLLVPLAVAVLGAFKEGSPEEYSQVVSPILGATSNTTYEINLSDPKLAAAIKDNEAVNTLDVKELADTVAAINWLKTVAPDSKIDVGISLAIYRGESANGQNLGNSIASQVVCSAQRSANFCAGERAAQKKLLQRWQDNQVATWDTVAAGRIKQDGSGNYVDYIGAGAGEIGPDGIIASTGVRICDEYLSKSPDKKIQSCDFYDKTISTFAKIVWLHMIGYRTDMTDAQKLEKLYGWNHDEKYRQSLIDGAKSFDTLLAGANLQVSTFSYYQNNDALTSVYSVANQLAQAFNLLPGNALAAGPDGGIGAQQWLQYPLAQKDYLGIISHYGEWRTNANGVKFQHGGTDFPCRMGVPVLAVAAGRVIDIEPAWIYNNISGYAVYIDVGNGLTIGNYHFLSSPYGDLVQPGQWVEKGQQIGRCGTTGDSTGYHTHLEVRINGNVGKGPFNQTHLVNPEDYLGKTVDPANIQSTTK